MIQGKQLVHNGTEENDEEKKFEMKKIKNIMKIRQIK